MRNLIFIATLFFSLQSFSKVRVMTFNTTCSTFCEKGKFDKFKKRKYWIVDTIKRSNPDIIALQEVFSSRQLKWFKKKLKNYDLFYAKFKITRFADPAIFVKKGKFKTHSKGGFWLGPSKRFNLGWTPGIPRRSQWMVLTDIESNKKFIFASAHFDNRGKNKRKSAEMVSKKYLNKGLPVIFAADTNIKYTHDEYAIIEKNFVNSYHITENEEFITNANTDQHDSCNLEKGKTFPDCMVDHILLSPETNWIVTNWAVDQFKYGRKQRFTSDHRAILADIEFD